jgi:3-hydroxyisobutyrate dehydrogenase-like beta-hydroxyacid dehydrogenase
MQVQGMAARLADWLRSHDSEFQEVLVWNRTAATAAQFADETPGVTALDCFEHVRDARVVVAMLSNDAAAEEVGTLSCEASKPPAARCALPHPSTAPL